MKPDELHPTRAALHDDDGRSAFVPGRRPWYNAVPTQQPPGPGGYNPTLNARRRAAQGYRERYPERRRASGRHPNRATSGLYCRGCNVPIQGAHGHYCIACRQRQRYEASAIERAKRELTTPYKGGLSRDHERRVKQLQAAQKTLPL